MENQKKFCSSCGGKLPDPAPKFCPFCGTSLSDVGVPADLTPETVDSNLVFVGSNFVPDAEPKDAVPVKVGFGKAVSLFWSRYFDFDGKSSRAEFWWAVLFWLVIEFSYGFWNYSLLYLHHYELVGGGRDPNQFIWSVVTFLPIMSLGCRRFHDAGARMNYWVFLCLLAIDLVILSFCNFLYGAGQTIFTVSLGFCGFVLGPCGGVALLIYAVVVCCSPSVGTGKKN